MRINSLIDARLFRRVIRTCGADLILHGHTHLATVESIPGPRGPVPVLSVPAASNGIGLFMPPARYNLFEIERTSDGWICLWTERGFEDPSGDLVTFRDRVSIGSLTDLRRSPAPVPG